MPERYKCNRRYILSNLDNSFAVLSDEEAANVCGGLLGAVSYESVGGPVSTHSTQFTGAATGNNSANLSEQDQSYVDSMRAMHAQQRAFNLQMAIIKNNNEQQQAAIRGSKQPNNKFA